MRASTRFARVWLRVCACMRVIRCLWHLCIFFVSLLYLYPFVHFFFPPFFFSSLFLSLLFFLCVSLRECENVSACVRVCERRASFSPRENVFQNRLSPGVPWFSRGTRRVKQGETGQAERVRDEFDGEKAYTRGR